jgi:hypothetical protein
MKIIKLYEEFMAPKSKKRQVMDKKSPDGFDPNLAIAKIKHSYNDYDVKSLVDAEIKELIEDDQVGDNYEGKVDWYYDNGSGEAEEIVVDQLIDWYQREYKEEFERDLSQWVENLSDEQRKEYLPSQEFELSGISDEELEELKRSILTKKIIETYLALDPNNY